MPSSSGADNTPSDLTTTDEKGFYHHSNYDLEPGGAGDHRQPLLSDGTAGSDAESVGPVGPAGRRKPSLLGNPFPASGPANNMFKFVLTLANSIIGVSILAMPFCFKQVRNMTVR